MAIKYTSEQEAIREAVNQEKGSILVEAGAGTAKTTTLKYSAQEVKEEALALAFNKSISQDLEEALPKHFTVRTMNALGHLAWGETISKYATFLSVDDRKVGKIIKETCKNLKITLKDDQWESIRDLVKAAQGAGLIPRDDKCYENTLMSDTQESWQELATAANVNKKDFPTVYKVANEVLIKDIAQARKGIVSFDDQIYCSVMLDGKFTQFPRVFVDEDQDLSPMNIKMVEKCLTEDGRIVAVGDKRQAIYAWRGAAGDSADRIKKLRDSNTWTELPLLTTFRCPQVIVKRQQEHLPGFRAWDGCHKGQIVNWMPDKITKMSDGWGWPQIKELLEKTPYPAKQDKAKIALLCRLNAPIVSLAIKFLKAGVGAKMLGRDIGFGLSALVKKLAPDDSTPVRKVKVLVESWKISELQKALEDDNETKAESIIDRADCILALLSDADCRTAADLNKIIMKLFDGSNGMVELSSIHRAKGLEWDITMIIDPWRIRNKPTEKEIEKASVSPIKRTILEQEWNLKYVAETRTRHTMILGNSANFIEK